MYYTYAKHKEKRHEARVDRLSDQSNYQPELYWDATYAIVLALMAHYPNHHPEDVGLHQLFALIVSLPGFKDDPAIVTERILLDIQNIWYEESVTL
jgi:FeS assembly protein IscX